MRIKLVEVDCIYEIIEVKICLLVTDSCPLLLFAKIVFNIPCDYFDCIYACNRVTLADQSTYEAKVVGFDQDKDVAVLSVDAPQDKLRPIPVGVSADLLVGQKVYAIGNPVSGLTSV